MNNPNSITVEFTFGKLRRLVDILTEDRDNKRWTAEREFPEDASDLSVYSIKGAEQAFTERAELAEYIGLLTGETPAETLDRGPMLDARRRYDAHQAAQADTVEV